MRQCPVILDIAAKSLHNKLSGVQVLYLVGGASRSGKSQVVKRLLSEKQVPYFPLDVIMMAFANGALVNHRDTPGNRSKVLWPFTETVINVTPNNIEDYAFEGDYFFPENLKSLEKRMHGRAFKAIFLGYSNIDHREKLKNIRRYASQTDWTKKRTDDELLEHIRVHSLFSRTLKEQCVTLGFNYLEASDDFLKYVDEAYRLLIADP